MRVAVTGASGFLGRQLIGTLDRLGHAIIAAVHDADLPLIRGLQSCKLDLLNNDSIARFIESSEADWIIHSAAITDVDRCEREPELAFALNGEATRQLVRRAAQASSRVLYLSTDYVFDGAAGPYDESAPVGPVNAYGKSKLQGEEAVLSAGSHIVVRSASFLGIGPPDHPTFAETIVRRLRESAPVTAAVDQCSNVTPVEYLAAGIAELIEIEGNGIYHIAGEEILSRFELTSRLAALLQLPTESVRAVPYASLNRVAARPLNGGLITRRPLGVKPPNLESSLRRFVEQVRARPH